MTYESIFTSVETETLYTALFRALSTNSYLMKPDRPTFTIVAVSTQHLELTGLDEKDMIGKGVFEVFPPNPADPEDTGGQDLEASLNYVLSNKVPHQLPVQRYDITGPEGHYIKKYWKAESRPVLTPEGTVAYIIHTTEDITDQVLAAEIKEQMKGMEPAYNLFMQIPIPLCMLKGPNLVVEFANEPTLQLWGRTKEVIGLPLEEAVPEVKGQGYADIIHEVRETGMTRQVYESPVTLLRNNKEELAYINYVYKPYYEKDKTTVAGVIAIGDDVTEKVLAKKRLADREAKYRTLFDSMDQGFCILEMIFDKNSKPIDYLFLEANPMFEEQTGLKSVVGKTAKELVPDLEPHWFEVYGKVALSGQATRFTEGSEAMGRWFDVYAFKTGDEFSYHVALFFTDITQRKKVEEAILEKDRQIRNMIYSAPVPMLVLRGEELVVEMINERMLEMLGKTDAIVNKPLLHSMPELKGQAGYESILTVYKTGKAQYGNSVLVPLLREGIAEDRYFNFAYTPVLENKNVVGIIDVATEVTELVKARQVAEESEAKFRTMAESTPVLITVGDETGNVTYYNKAWTELTGLSMPEILQRQWTGLIHIEDRDQLARVYHDAFTRKAPFHGEFRVTDVGGKEYWLLAHGVPRFDTNGKFVGYIAACTNITEHKTLQQQLQTALEQVRLSKEAAELGTFDLDLEKGTMHWDERCRTLFGISHRGPVAYEKDFAEGLHPDDRERILKVIEKLFIKSISNGDYDVEYRTVGAEDGIIRWVRAKGKVYFNEEEKPVRFIGSVLDITEKVAALQKIELLVEERTKELAEANETLQNINKELNRSNQNLEEFAHAASHDLKEPVRKIHFYTHQLKEQLHTRLKESELRSFNRIENASQRMGNLIDDLLLYSHVSHRPHETETVDLNQKVQNVLEDLELDIEEKKAVIHVNRLPKVRGYRRQLQQIFQNLVSNALKYSKQDVPPQIDISASMVTEHGKSMHMIKVEDNGIGFEPVYAEKIFHMFTRLHGNAEFSGTGVGLSIVKKVVENHNGFIKVESTPGKGSSFMIFLPAD
ncbi:MAG TPA: PAS domain S-box protein [Chitinophagaceae bacterium]|nr:PAS domain S-box protein [Chitinophagaceae bacterium]